MTDNISSLVKFCTADSGLKILNSQSLRWSAPHLFNDPFQPNHRLDAQFTTGLLLKGLINEAINMLFGPTEPSGKSNRVIAAIARWRTEERFGSEEEAELVLKQLLVQIAQQQQQQAEEYLANWRQFSSSLRICSFSDKPSNMAAWQRFADNHAGIALRFSAGQDTALPSPKRMKYSALPPTISSLKEQVTVAYGKATMPSSDDFLEKMLSKDKNNSAEREWCCFSTATGDTDADQQLWYSTNKFSTPELKSVYLGLAIGEQEKALICQIVKKKYKNTKLYIAHALPGRFEVDFEPLTP